MNYLKAPVLLCTFCFTFACSEAESSNDNVVISSVQNHTNSLSDGSSSDFDFPNNWFGSQNITLTHNDLSTEGTSSLQHIQIDQGEQSWMSSRPFQFKHTIRRISLDLLLPDMRMSSNGSLTINLSCPSLGVINEEIAQFNTLDIATGRFETVSQDLPAHLEQTLSKGCEDLSLKIEFHSLAPNTPLLIDRFSFDYSVKSDETPLCGIPINPYDPSEELPNGYLKRHLWRSGVATHFEIARIQDALSEEPSILGFTADDITQQFIIVVDSENPKESIQHLTQHLIALKPIIPLTIRPSCRKRSELEIVRNALNEGTFHHRAKDAAIDYNLNVAESHYEAFINPIYADVAEELTRRYGSLVKINYTPLLAQGRFDDGTPHYGGAAIWFSGPGGADCTGGFAVNNGSERGAVSAGHCANSIGQAIFSGPHSWGQVGHFLPHTSLWDMVYVEPTASTETWSARIHTDPCCPVNRPVTAKSPPYLTQLVCVSGRNFQAKCSVEINQFNPTRNIDYKTLGTIPRAQIWEGRRLGVAITMEGDSGAPIYVPIGYGEAAIVGMNIASLKNPPYDVAAFHSVTDIETQLGVTVAY